MPRLTNRARMTVTGTPGTGTITLNAAVTNYQTFAASGVLDGQYVRYVVEDGTAWEIGIGRYTTSGTTLTRGLESSSTASLISLTSAAQVFIDAAARDIVKKGLTVAIGQLGCVMP